VHDYLYPSGLVQFGESQGVFSDVNVWLRGIGVCVSTSHFRRPFSVSALAS
jgi:hypothetical protein